MSFARHVIKISLLFCFLIPIPAFVQGLCAAAAPSEAEQTAAIVRKMEAAYSVVNSYQTETEVSEYREGELTETKRFLYTFKKPGRIRMDMKTPHSGLVLVYPDRKGRVFVKPSGWTGFLRFHLSLDSTFLRNSSGQRIDQTDMGLLIRNISRSLTDNRSGNPKISEQHGLVVVQVLAEDHFLSGVRTLYRFSIDKTFWLPVGVEEFDPDGMIKRKVIFRNLKTSVAIPEDFFATD